MGRSQRERDELFAQYEGLAEKAAGYVWGIWGRALDNRGHTLDDLRQQAKLDLLVLAEGAEDIGGGFPTYVWRTLTGSLRNVFVNSGILRDPGRIPQEVLANLPDSSAKPPDETVYYIGEGSPSAVDEFCQRVLAGDSELEARRAVGWTKAEQREAMAGLRRELEKE